VNISSSSIGILMLDNFGLYPLRLIEELLDKIKNHYYLFLVLQETYLIVGRLLCKVLSRFIKNHSATTAIIAVIGKLK